VQELKKN